MEPYVINFDKPDVKRGVNGYTATVHLIDSICDRGHLQRPKRPGDGEWVSSKFLPEEMTTVIKDGKEYTVIYCGQPHAHCMADSDADYEHSQFLS